MAQILSHYLEQQTISNSRIVSVAFRFVFAGCSCLPATDSIEDRAVDKWGKDYDNVYINPFLSQVEPHCAFLTCGVCICLNVSWLWFSLSTYRSTMLLQCLHHIPLWQSLLLKFGSVLCVAKKKEKDREIGSRQRWETETYWVPKRQYKNIVFSNSQR